MSAPMAKTDPAKTDPAKSAPANAEDKAAKPPGPSDETAAPAQTAQVVAPEDHPLHRAYWTKHRMGIAALVLLILGGGIYWLTSGTSEPKTVYVVTPATRSDVTVMTRANGQLALRQKVEIGASSEGKVENVAVAAGDLVTTGQVLVRLSSLNSHGQLVQAQDALAYAQANLKQAEADLAETRADAARASFLREHHAAAPGQYESAQAALARGSADVDKERAEIRSAQTRVALMQSQIGQLDIRAPIDGVILKRDVEPGQAVRVRDTALLTLSSDVTRLNLEVAFLESQLGALKLGQTARFTVPAFPRRRFTATLATLDLLPQHEREDDGLGGTVERVTYKGTLDVNNTDHALRPGMSARLGIVLAEVKNVLVVPNAALVYAPTPKGAARSSRAARGLRGGRTARVWVYETGGPQIREVTLGLTDGINTEVRSGNLQPGEKIITGAVTDADSN